MKSRRKHSWVHKLSKCRGFISCYNAAINWHIHQRTSTPFYGGIGALYCVWCFCRVTDLPFS